MYCIFSPRKIDSLKISPIYWFSDPSLNLLVRNMPMPKCNAHARLICAQDLATKPKYAAELSELRYSIPLIVKSR